MNSVSDLVDRARHQYSTGGISSLISGGARFATKQLWLEMLIRRKYMSRSELKLYGEHEGNIWYGKKEEPFEIGPVSHPTLREKFERYPKEYSPERPFVCELQNCRLLGNYALGMTEEGQIIPETTPYNPRRLSKEINEHFDNQKDYLRLFGFRSRSPARRIDDRVFPLVRNSGYYHWLVEYLPKIRLLEFYTKETGHKPTLIVNSNPSNFVKDSLKAVGYGPNEYEEWEGGDVQISNLVVPLHRTHVFDHYKPEQSNYNLSRKDLYWLRNRIRSKIDRTGGDRKIYISRQKAKNKKVTNYDEVESIITGFGFETYVLEDISFRRQVELFAEAEVIMGPHGAGLANMIFAEDPLVIEMVPEDTLRPYFYFISEVMDFDHEPIITEAEDRNLIVDVDTLRVHLESLLD